MKRIFFLSAFIWMMSALSAQTSNSNDAAQNLDPKLVPAVAVQNFNAQFPSVTPAWHLDGKDYRASYIDPQSKLGRIIVYDKDGQVVRSENEVDNTGYPSAIGDFYSDNYPGETYQVWSTDDKTGARTLYYSNRNEETLWFDKDGKTLPAKKATNEVKKDPRKK